MRHLKNMINTILKPRKPLVREIVLQTLLIMKMINMEILFLLLDIFLNVLILNLKYMTQMKWKLILVIKLYLMMVLLIFKKF